MFNILRLFFILYILDISGEGNFIYIHMCTILMVTHVHLL